MLNLRTTSLCVLVVSLIWLVYPVDAAASGLTGLQKRAWQTASKVFPQPRKCGPVNFVRVSDAKIDADANTGFAAMAAVNGCTMFLPPRLSEADFTTQCSVLAHEDGHLRGLGHDPQPGRLMSALNQALSVACIRATIVLERACKRKRPSAIDRCMTRWHLLP